MLFINIFIISPGLTLIGVWNNNIKCRFDVESFPSIFEIFWQITLLSLMNDFTFYWSHRTLHHPAIYKYIHKYHHEYNQTIALCAEYAHPVEYLVGNILPNLSGFLILGNRLHFYTMLIWQEFLLLSKDYVQHLGHSIGAQRICVSFRV